MLSKKEKDAVIAYLSGKLPFKDERDLAGRLQLLARVGVRIARFERRFGAMAKVLIWVLVLGLLACVGYWWAHRGLPAAAIHAAISNDLEFVRYRGDGLAIVYDHDLNETGRVQLNLTLFYSLRIALAVLVGSSAFFFFRRAYVPTVPQTEHPTSSNGNV